MPEGKEEKKKGITLTKTQVIIGIVCGILVILGSLYGVVDHFVVKFRTYDDTLVHVPEFEAFQQQVNEQTLQNRIDFYQRIVWDLEELHNTREPLQMDHDAEKYRTALKNLDIATHQLAVVQGKDDSK